MKKDMDEIVRDLEAAAYEEGTEAKECWRGLCGMWRVANYGCSDKFINALEQEIREQYAYLKNNFTWVEHKEVPCDKCGRGRPHYRELVWNEDLNELGY